MTSAGVTLLVIAAVLVVVAAVLASADAALSSISRVRAEELVRERRRGAPRLLVVVNDPPRFLNTALLLRILCETTATVLVTLVVAGATTTGGSRDGLLDPTWLQVLLAAGVMVVVSYIAVGVGPRTLGRQHSERVGLMTAGAVAGLTAVLGPIPQLLIVIGNALTPGRGFREGPFATEAELRELVDLAAQSRVIESGESKMIHSVFELGDTLVREVMVPRTEMVVIERYKTLRQVVSLALRSGFSRIPVVGDSIDDVVGMAYLKDVVRRVFENRDAESTERIEKVMRGSLFVPDSKPVNVLLREMQTQRMHVAIVVDEYGGTAGMVTIEDILEEIVGEITDEHDTDERPPVEHLDDDTVRVSARLGVDDLGELFGVELEPGDVETVGGLLAQRLGRVPLPGAEAEVAGLRLRAEGGKDRRGRMRITTVTAWRDTEPAGTDDGEATRPPEGSDTSDR